MKSVSTAQPNQLDSHDHLQVGALHHAMQVSAEEGPSLREGRFPHTTGVAIQAVQPQPRRLADMKPGTVVFTNEPRIPIDRALPLPDEDVLIRSGGNGEIYCCTVEGLRVAVKKTSYRYVGRDILAYSFRHIIDAWGERGNYYKWTFASAFFKSC